MFGLELQPGCKSNIFLFCILRKFYTEQVDMEIY